MSYPTFSGNTYAGELFAPYLRPLVLNSRTFNDGIVKLMPNVTGKAVLRKVDQAVVFQDNIETFNASGDQTLSETVLEPIRMTFMTKYDVDALYQSWEDILLQNGGINKVPMPTELESAIVTLAAEKISSFAELLVWQGKSANSTVFGFTGSFAGFFATAKTDAPVAQKSVVGDRGRLTLSGITNDGVVTVSSTANLRSGDYVTIGLNTNGNQTFNGTSIKGLTFPIVVASGTTIQLINASTGANAALAGGTAATTGSIGFINQYSVQDAFESATRILPNRVKFSGQEVRLYVSPDVMTAYKDSIAQSRSLTAGYLDYRTGNYESISTDTFKNIKVEAVPSITGNQVLCGVRDNLVVGLAAVSDFGSMTISDMRPLSENNIRFRSAWGLDAKIPYANEVSYLDAVVPA